MSAVPICRPLSSTHFRVTAFMSPMMSTLSCVSCRIASLSSFHALTISSLLFPVSGIYAPYTLIRCFPSSVSSITLLTRAAIMSTSCSGSTFLSLSVFHTMVTPHLVRPRPRLAFCGSLLVPAPDVAPVCPVLASASVSPSLSPQATLVPYPSRSHLPITAALSSSVVVLSEMTPRSPRWSFIMLITQAIASLGVVARSFPLPVSFLLYTSLSLLTMCWPGRLYANIRIFLISALLFRRPLPTASPSSHALRRLPSILSLSVRVRCRGIARLCTLNFWRLTDAVARTPSF